VTSPPAWTAAGHLTGGDRNDCNRRGGVLGRGLHELGRLATAILEQPVLQLLLQVMAVRPGEGLVQAGQWRVAGTSGNILFLQEKTRPSAGRSDLIGLAA
jgi:hypothetical protein